MNLNNIGDLEFSAWIIGQTELISRLPEKFKDEINSILSGSDPIFDKKELIVGVLSEYTKEMKEQHAALPKNIFFGAVVIGGTAWLFRYFSKSKDNGLWFTELCMMGSLFMAIIGLCGICDINF